MATYTTNYNLAKPEGTDAYNHLIYDNPNMDIIDAALKSIDDLTVSRATCVKTGTNHAVTRLNTDAVVFRFTATGDFNAGDTMTVDGVSVSVFLPNGEAANTGAYIINSEVLAAIQGTRVTLYTNSINQINANKVVYDNTLSGLTATNAQDAIDELNSKEIAFAAKESVTLPFTATDTGFLYVFINPQSASGGYVGISTGESPAFISTANGNGTCTWMPINKGETATITSSSNVSLSTAFRKITIS